MQDIFENTRVLAGLDQIDVKFAEVFGVFPKCFVEITTGFDIGLDRHDQFLHGRILMTASDDFKRLHQRYAGRHHGGELARENGDFLGRDRAAAAEQWLGFLFDLERIDALTPKLCFDERIVAPRHFPFDSLPGFVDTFPGEHVGLDCSFCHWLTPLSRD